MRKSGLESSEIVPSAWPPLNAWALWSGFFTTAIAGFYAVIIHNQNEADLTLPRVQFLIVFIAAMGVVQVAGGLASSPVLRTAFLGSATLGLAGMMVVGAFSIGSLFFISEFLAVPALIEVLRNRRHGFSLLIAAASGCATVISLAVGLLLFPLN